jgi:hypothetical protein
MQLIFGLWWTFILISLQRRKDRNTVIQSLKWNAIESVAVVDIHSGKRPVNAQWNVGIASRVTVDSDQSKSAVQLSLETTDKYDSVK